jgi:ketosteroid isomerase-like protein
MAMMTEDVVFLAAHAPPMVGKPAVRPWAESYLQAFTTFWDKQSQELVMAGDWAFERYSTSPRTRRAEAARPCWTLAGV